MLLTLVPLFDENMAVCAYSFFTQRENYLLNPLLLGTAQFDGASQITGLELIQKMGIDTLSQGKEIFVPITNISIFADITEQCDAPHEKIVLLIDNTIPPIEMYVNRLKELKQQGYKLAIRKLAVSDFENYREVLKLMDYVLLNNRKIAIDKAKIYFGKLFPNISLCAGNIDTMEDFERLKETGGYRFYEGKFYRVPITKGQTDVAPLKGNYIDLLNIVNSPDFELTTAADIFFVIVAILSRQQALPGKCRSGSQHPVLCLRINSVTVTQVGDSQNEKNRTYQSDSQQSISLIIHTRFLLPCQNRKYKNGL